MRPGRILPGARGSASSASTSPPGDDPAAHRDEVHRPDGRARRAARPTGGSPCSSRTRRGSTATPPPASPTSSRRVDSPASARLRPGELRRGRPADRRGLGPAPATFVQHFHVKDYDAKLERNVPAGAGDGQIPRLIQEAVDARLRRLLSSSSRTWSSPSCRTASPAPNASPTPSPPSRASSTSGRSPTSETSRTRSARPNRRTHIVIDPPLNRRVFLEQRPPARPCGASGSSRRGPTSRPASPRPARSATSRSRWPNGRSTRPSSRSRSTTSTSPRSPASSTGSTASSSSTSSSRTRPRTRPTSRT